MPRVIALVMMAGLLVSCSDEPIADHELDNERILGTVVSVKRTKDFNWQGAGDIARSGNAQVGNVATGGLFSGWWNTSAPSGSDVNPTTGLSYVIETEEGQRIRVLASDRRVYYPGDEVLVVRNPQGFSEVYPRDLSHAQPGGL